MRYVYVDNASGARHGAFDDAERAAVEAASFPPFTFHWFGLPDWRGPFDNPEADADVASLESAIDAGEMEVAS